MSEHASVPALTGRDWAKSKLFLGMSFGDYLKSHRRFGRSELPLDNPPRATK